jgi:hypothetical protein
VKKFISIIAACISALALAAGIGPPTAAADPTNDPGPGPTVANQPPGRDLVPIPEPLPIRQEQGTPGQGNNNNLPQITEGDRVLQRSPD